MQFDENLEQHGFEMATHTDCKNDKYSNGSLNSSERKRYKAAVVKPGRGDPFDQIKSNITETDTVSDCVVDLPHPSEKKRSDFRIKEMMTNKTQTGNEQSSKKTV